MRYFPRQVVSQFFSEEDRQSGEHFQNEVIFSVKILGVGRTFKIAVEVMTAVD